MSTYKPRRLSQIIDGAQLFASVSGVDGLMSGWRKVSENRGAAGGDGISIDFFAAALAQRLTSLSSSLRGGDYFPGPLRRVDIPKASGGLRRLAIPCVRDRVAQSAVAQALGPRLEEEFEDSSYGYRPGRGVADAVRRVEALRREGFIWTLDADIESYFDSVPIDRLMNRLAQAVNESPLLTLINVWLEHGAERGRGLPQGSPLSPLLANLYLDGLDEEMSTSGLRIVRYADDFLVLAKDRPALEGARNKVARLLADNGLTLNTQKTAIRSYEDSLRFLGHVFVRGWALKSDDDEDSVSSALSAVAKADEAAQAEAERLAKGEALLDDAGLDRGLRVLHVRRPGRRLSLRNLAFSVRAAAEEARPGSDEIAAIHHTRVDRIEIGPEATGEYSALLHALGCAIPVSFVDGHGKTMGHLAPSLAPRASRHLAQARHVLDPALRAELARRIARGRISNMRALLRRLNHRHSSEAVARTCVALNGIERRLRATHKLDALRGWEGAATKLFWRAYSALLLHGLTLPYRRRRQGAGPVNVALDVVSGLVLRDVAAVVSAAGLHPGFGALHGTDDYHDGCVYDLMEEFRAGLLESVVLTAFNIKSLSTDDFSKFDKDQWRIGREGMEALIRLYEQRAERPVIDPVTGKRASWRTLMRLQAERYAAHVEGRAPYEPFVLDH